MAQIQCVDKAIFAYAPGRGEVTRKLLAVGRISEQLIKHLELHRQGCDVLRVGRIKSDDILGYSEGQSAAHPNVGATTQVDLTHFHGWGPVRCLSRRKSEAEGT